MLVGSGKTHIRRLRARSHERDALALRLRLDAALSAMDLHPTGVPASAIVCVRELRTTRRRGPGRDSPEAARSWEREVTSRLASIVARAARPARGPVPEGAEAVLFADRAELLACLANDWLKGAAAAERWWWRSLLSARAGSRALVFGVWMETPEHVPAALEHLARAGAAVRLARSLNDAEASSLLASVAHAYGVAELREAFAAGPLSGAGNAGLSDDARGAGEDARPPWHGRVEEGRARGLGVEQQTLLGFGLMLARAPHVARSHAFARELLDWRLKRDAQARHKEPPARDERTQAAPAAPAAEGRSRLKQVALHAPSREEGGASGAPKQTSPDSPVEERRREGGEGSGRGRRAETGSQGAGEEGGRPRVEAGRQGVGAEDIRGGVEQARVEEHERDAGGSRSEGPAASPDLWGEAAGATSSPQLIEASVQTRLGGLFYLVNVGLFLELYGDFTTPQRPGLALPLWDFVALVGRELYGGAVCEDPVWALLARLAGRGEEEEPGQGFSPPADWRVPPSWLKPFGGEGFDVSFERREPGGEAGGLKRWVGRVTEHVRARLRLALGVGGEREVAGLVCEQEARVVVTASHVDVHFRLSGLPVEIRLAGLDRDPGWVPAAGRFVAFHYE